MTLGSNNDSGVLNNSQMGKPFKQIEMCVPDPEKIEGTGIILLYFLVGD